MLSTMLKSRRLRFLLAACSLSVRQSYSMTYKGKGKMRRASKIVLASLVVAVCLGSATLARADMVVFTSRAAFTAAATNLQNINFEGLPSVPVFGVLTLSGVGFSGINGVIPVTAPNFGYTGPGTALVNIGVPEVSGINVTLPGGITAIGTDLLTFSPDNRSPIVITLSTGATFTFSGDPLPARQFIGFTSDVAITSLIFSSRSNNLSAASRIGVDDFVFGQVQANPIPEPSTVVLLSTGLAGVGTAVRRQRKARRGGRLAGGSSLVADRA